ncbi:Ribosomal protein S5 [Venturia nashicola]|uniref:Small ribosomal subunit protein uS5m n=1 Tax=Venturia nashicola TaxID=86259 RepID=A0A4Z1PAN2_9PEZI|nr:Ribosomal protein S5 [Venturia nashicola]TLD34858.1 Ribosomal protein S5 [Venturia nashicola]
MSVSHSAPCLLRRNAAALCSSSPASFFASKFRRYSSSPILHTRRRRGNYESLSQEQLRSLNEMTKNFPAYTREEKEAMKHHYTPAQLEALNEAEKAIDLRDMVTQGRFRKDHWRPPYIDDFTSLDPFLDRREQKPVPQSSRLHIMSEDEFIKRVNQRAEDPRSTNQIFHDIEAMNLPEERQKFVNSLKRWKDTDKEDAVRQLLHGISPPAPLHLYGGGKYTPSQQVGLDPRDPLAVIDLSAEEKAMWSDPAYSALAPAIPKFDDPRIRFSSADDDDAAAAGLKRLALQTGFDTSEIKTFRVKNLVVHRVVNQTRMGKIASEYNLTIAGNRAGLLGIGEGKSSEPEDSRRQAMLNAIRNMKPINRYEDRTIYGDVRGKVGAVEVHLSSRPPGFGIRCQHLIFEMCRCAGIQDLSARSIRSRNPMNTVKATFEALTSQILPDDIARARGRKLVDLRKVYYAGQVSPLT